MAGSQAQSAGQGGGGQAGQKTSTLPTREKPSKDDEFQLPRRPAPIQTPGFQVQTNHFILELSRGLKPTGHDDVVFVYHPTIQRILPGGAKKHEDGRPPSPVKGGKLKTVMREVIEKLRAHHLKLKDPIAVASDYLAQLVTNKEVRALNNVVPDTDFQVDLQDGGSTFNVTLGVAQRVSFRALQDYVDKTQAGWTADSGFPKHQEEVNALNIILGHWPRSRNQTITVGNNRFFDFSLPGHELSKLGGGEQTRYRGFWHGQGYFQSVRLAKGNILLNANVSNGAFRKPMPLTELFTTLHINRTNGQQVDDLGKLLIGAPVEMRVRNVPEGETEYRETIQYQTIKSLSPFDDNPKSGHRVYQGPAQVTFELTTIQNGDRVGTGQRMTVSQFHRDPRRYPGGLQPNGNWPVMNVGRENSPIWIPAERLALKLSHVKGILDSNEMIAMVEMARLKPYQVAGKVRGGARTALGLDPVDHVDHVLRDFNIQVNPSLINVKARHLKPPALLYKPGNSGSDTLLSPKDGKWNMSGKYFAKPYRDPIDKWSVLTIGMGSQNHHQQQQFQTALTHFATRINNSTGLIMAAQATDIAHHHDVLSSRGFFGLATTAKVQLLIVILPRNDAQMYRDVKSIAEVTHGIRTICTVKKNFLKGHPQYIGNMAMKLNLKFGGNNLNLKNQSPYIEAGNTMFIGYDVIHPAPPKGAEKDGKKGGGKTGEATGQTSERKESTDGAPGKDGRPSGPSIVGMVASVDSNLSQWPGVAWSRRGGLEITEEGQDDPDLMKAFLSRLVLYKNRNPKKPPTNIIVYRDGVSEGQFEHVVNRELPCLRAACKKIGCKAAITMVVAVKRHNTRFFLPAPNKGGMEANVAAGTVVDQGVTHDAQWDFYLNSHNAIAGTSRPAHYVVLHDEVFRRQGRDNATAAAELERLTNDLCYVYGASTTAVSYCAPAYLADRVCTRANMHFSSGLVQRIPTPPKLHNEWPVNAVNVNPALVNTMFYI